VKRDRRRTRLLSALAGRQRRWQRQLDLAWSVVMSAEPLELADMLHQPYY